MAPTAEQLTATALRLAPSYLCADTEPLRRFVTRTSSFTKEDFEQLLKTPGMFTVKDAATQMRGITSVARLRSGRPARSRQLLQQPTQPVRRRRRRYGMVAGDAN